MQKLLNKLFLFNVTFKENEHAIKHKFIFLNNVFFFTTMTAFGMAFIRWPESKLLGILDLGFSFVSLCMLIYLHYNKHQVELVSTIALAMSFVLFFIIYLLAPENSTRISLFLLLSASAFFLKGRRKGFIWMAIIISGILFGYMAPNFNIGYYYLDIISICFYLLGLYFVFDNYQNIQDEQTIYLENLNEILEQKVIERTKELEEVNCALQIEKQLLKNISSTDQLTGLHNRYKLEDIFEFEKLQMERHDHMLSIILMDIDYFKSINDTEGHNAGDQVLQEIAIVLKNNVRKSDVTVRWGGEEFVILSPKTSLAQAMNLAEKLRKTISEHHFKPWKKPITSSFGVTSYEVHDTFEKMIQRADTALYMAKNSGRNNVKSFVEKPNIEE